MFGDGSSAAELCARVQDDRLREIERRIRQVEKRNTDMPLSVTNAPGRQHSQGGDLTTGRSALSKCFYGNHLAHLR